MSLDDTELSALIRRHATRHEAPDALRAGLRTQVALAEAGRVPAPPAGTPARRRLPVWSAVAGFALGMLCMAVLRPLVLPWPGSPAPGPGSPAAPWRGELEDELVARHVRALGPGPLADVVASDRHMVKPWFQGRVDFAPPVFDLAAEGFPLMGARVEPLRGRQHAALVYMRRRHVIDLFIRPSSEVGAAPDPAAAAASAPLLSQRRGFTVMHWDDGAMQYWLVSDIERGEAEVFVQQWRARAAAQ